MLQWSTNRGWILVFFVPVAQKQYPTDFMAFTFCVKNDQWIIKDFPIMQGQCYNNDLDLGLWQRTAEESSGGYIIVRP